MEAENNIKTVAVQVPLNKLRVQCAGPNFMKYLATVRHGINGNLSNASSTDKISDAEFEFEIDVDYLRSLDPKEWKDQDHYHVLGLKKLRINATDDDIRRAYRKIVLKHHPDKRKAQGEDVRTDDDYFHCITKAYETLGDKTKRRSYDSIDPEFDESLPTAGDVEKRFYEKFHKYFTLNARWSEKKNVPVIGDANATRQEVDNFYNFWYEFDSWREYSYLDEEDKDKGQDREERRWIEKQNRTIRLKRKKEEMARIRSLVDLAYNNDPRIVKFRNDDKERKQAAKRARMSVAQAARAEEDRAVKEAQLAKEKAEQAEQKRIEQIRLEKEQQKRALKKERKLLRDTAKEQSYYSTSDKEKIRNAEGVEKICEMLKYLELQAFNKELAANGRDAFIKTLKETEAKLEEERRSFFDPKPAAVPVATKSAVAPVEKNIMWTPENMQILIKAVNLFPAGTVQRWEVISNYLNQHALNLGNKKFMARDVLNKAKDLQASDFTKNTLKSQANDDAFASFQKSKKELKIIDVADISVNEDGKEKVKEVPAEKTAPAPAAATKKKGQAAKPKQNGVGGGESTKTKEAPATKPATATEPLTNGHATKETPSSTEEQPATTKTKNTWHKDEQALLEQALKTYPVNTADRWERIAECIPNRTKKECLRRVKELIDMVSSKKDAQHVK